MSKTFTKEEVAQHNKDGDVWVIIDGGVYDLSKFAKLHPGGKAAILHPEVAGKDATDQFYSMHLSNTLDAPKYKKLKIGTLVDAGKSKIKKYQPGKLSRVPLAEPLSAVGAPNPYYKESHHKFRAAIRKFNDIEVIPEAMEEEEGGEPPSREMWKKVGKFGILVARVGKSAMRKEWMDAAGVSLPGGISVDEFDMFHEQIAHEEYGRLGAPSYQDGLGAGFVIGLMPVVYFAPKPIQDKVIPECISGDKRICLAVSEAWVGSDVANLKTFGRLSDDKKHWIVSGHKKWITNGAFCDYFVTAVRTGGKGMKGISLMLIERSEGLTTKPMKTAYGSCAGTSYVFYDEVKVPVENIMGELNDGFKCIMWNFNHERWFIIASLISAMRLCYEDCILWMNQRMAFGTNLMSQPVLRQHLAKIQAGLEFSQAMIDNITYQMEAMSLEESAMKLAAPIALLKYQVTRFSWQQADLAAQILGGRAITKTGLGCRVERFIRGNKYGAILGGSEEIMADFSVRITGKKFLPPGARM